MKKYLSLIAIISISSLNAGEFHSLGGQSISMGGAGVASARGSLAGYYNPALLANRKDVEVSIGVGLAVRDNNLGEQIDTLSNSNLSDVIERVANKAPFSGSNTQEDRDSLIESQDALKSIGNKNGIDVMPSAHFSVQYDNFSVGLYLTGDIVASANVDKEHTELSVNSDGHYYSYDPKNDSYSLITQERYNNSSLEYALDNRLSTVSAKGLLLTEVPVSYAHSFALPQGDLSLGGSLKFMNGTTYTETFDIDSEDTDNEDRLKENERDSSNVGLDIGILFKPANLSNLQLGLVGKNLNAPSFETSTGKDIEVSPQVRAGLLYKISDDLDIATDLDLTTNETFIRGFDTQMFGGGLDYHPVSWFSIRGGLMSNLANSNDGMIYTAGLAFGLPQFQLDVSAQMSENEGSYDSETVPKYAKVNVAIVSRW